MRDFNSLCEEIQGINPLSYGVVLAQKSFKIIPAITVITRDGADGAEIFSRFIIGAMAADGRLAEEEYHLCEPVLTAFFGNAISYEMCNTMVKLYQKNEEALKKSAGDMIHIIGALSDELKEDIITVCLMICAVDGEIAPAEEQWIKQLIS